MKRARNMMLRFNRNLQSFDCAVDFSWKQHFTETTRVGDEGTDEELEKLFQPIRNRVTVTRQNVTVSSGLTDGCALQAHIGSKNHLDIRGLHLEGKLVTGRGLFEDPEVRGLLPVHHRTRSTHKIRLHRTFIE